MLGDRLVRAQAPQERRRIPRRAGGAPPGDLVVHADHGIARYEGLTRSRSARRRTIASRWNMPAATSSTCRSRISSVVPLRRRRRAGDPRPPRRRSLAAAQVADEGADPRDCRRIDQDRSVARHPPRRVAEPMRPIPNSSTAFPMRRPKTRTGPSRRCSTISRPAGRWTGWCAATSASARPRWRCAPPSSRPWPAIRSRWSARPPCSPASITGISSSASTASRSRSGGCRGWSGGRGQEDQGRPRGGHGRHRHRHPCAAGEIASSSRSLGLVIVDEEQHFGVAHKERLKALRADVHVLTLTATPIPRTLQMAMSGLRELSVIQTPPVDRLAVRTYVTPWDPSSSARRCCASIIAAARASSSSPRIADLPDMEEWLREEVPEVKAVTAHGQMSATEVEERMSAFYDRKYDVLLSTTIVESGLDIPSRQHADRPPRRPLRPGPALPAARPRRPVEDPGLCLSDDACRPLDDRGRAKSGCRCWPISTASARASSWPATTSTFAAPAICSATSSRATSRKSASSSTSRCWRTRSSR